MARNKKEFNIRIDDNGDVDIKKLLKYIDPNLKFDVRLHVGGIKVVIYKTGSPTHLDSKINGDG